MVNVFAVPGKSDGAITFIVLNCSLVFFLCLRETLETSIVVSILLAFLKQTLGPDRDAATYKRLRRQVNAQMGLQV